MLEVTESAAAVLQRAHEAATRFNPDARIRVFLRDGVIETELTDAVKENDIEVEAEGIVFLVASDVGDGLLDVTDSHDRLVVKPR